MSSDELRDLADRYLWRELDRAELDAARIVAEAATNPDAREIRDEQLTEALTEAHREYGSKRRHKAVQVIARDLLKEAGLELAPESPEFDRLCLGIFKAQHEAALHELALLRGEFGAASRATGTAARRAYSAAPAALLSDIVNRFIAYKTAQGAWTDKTEAGFKAILVELIELLGDLSGRALSKAHLLTYYESLAKMPSHAAKKFPGLNAREVLAQSAGMDIPRLSPKSINDRLTTVKAFLSWAADAELVAEGLGRVLKPLPDEAGRHKRKPLDAAEVRAFLALCKADGTTAAQRLIPAICAYSGARLNEIAQLDRDDIQRVDGIWIFKIQGGEGKALKTANAARTVPIHSSLVDAVLGQLKTVPKGNLWGLEIGHNRHSGALSKWLARKLDAVTDDRKKVVHSLRHSVATQLKGRGFAEYLIESLLGHASKSMSTGRYGHEVPVAKLAELVESIAYEP